MELRTSKLILIGLLTFIMPTGKYFIKSFISTRRYYVLSIYFPRIVLYYGPPGVRTFRPPPLKTY